MLDFSQKAAKRFRLSWPELEERSGDFWRIDVVMFGHVPLLMLVHEYTLFTLVRRKAHFTAPLEIAAEIQHCCPWYRYVGQPTFGKNGNKRLTGSMNQMKRDMWGMFSPDQTNAIEMYINNDLFSYLAVEKRDYGKPFEAVERYINGQMPWLEREGR